MDDGHAGPRDGATLSGMDGRLVALAAADCGLVTVPTAQRAGIPRAVLRWAHERGELTRLRSGIWCPTPLWESLGLRGRHRLAVAAAQRKRPRGVAVAQSAAVLLGLPLPDDPPLAPLLLEPRDADRRGGDGGPAGLARRAWLDPDEVWVLPDGLRVTAPARTVVDLARHLELPWALAAADVARSRWRATTRRLLEAAARNPCAPGHPGAVLVAKEADPRSESPLESVARGVMIMLGLPRAQPQAWVRCVRRRYRVDLRVEECWTVVEADGKVKYRDPDEPGEQDWLDKRRRDDLHDTGYEVVRFVAADAHHPHAWGRRCVRAFERAHERRGLRYQGSRPDWLRIWPESA